MFLFLFLNVMKTSLRVHIFFCFVLFRVVRTFTNEIGVREIFHRKTNIRYDTLLLLLYVFNDIIFVRFIRLLVHRNSVVSRYQFVSDVRTQNCVTGVNQGVLELTTKQAIML